MMFEVLVKFVEGGAFHKLGRSYDLGKAKIDADNAIKDGAVDYLICPADTDSKAVYIRYSPEVK